MEKTLFSRTILKCWKSTLFMQVVLVFIFNKLLKTFHQLLSHGPYMGTFIFSEEDNMPQCSVAGKQRIEAA